VLSAQEQYKIVDDNIKGISVREEFEKLIDKAEDDFGKDGDLDKFVDEKETLKARARKGGLQGRRARAAEGC
jgi:hypothetical protein